MTPSTTTTIATTSVDFLQHIHDARGVHTLTLNDPARYNVLSIPMMDALQAAVREIAGDGAARVLVIAATGKAFCAGHDLKEMIHNAGNTTELQLAYYQKMFKQCGDLMMQLQNLPLPVVAKVQGVATAAGCQLVAQCDLAVSSPSARYAVSGITLGLYCSTPSVSLVRNVGMKKAFEMLATGDFISAEDAKAQGLINSIAADDSPEAVDALLEGVLAKLLNKSKSSLAIGKELLYSQRELGVAAAYQLAAQTMAHNMVQPDTFEGICAFVNKTKK